jgi:formylglycine-generating enzyme required for sulfatase activity
VGVSWYEAVAFCRWLSEELKRRGELKKEDDITLPSEAQWERAARHTDGRTYPWGDAEELKTRCNMRDTGIGHTSAVGLFPGGKAECGALDMAGNVWEWCRTKWMDNYTNYEQRARELDELDGSDARVLRGGSWFDGVPRDLSCSYRNDSLPVNRYDDFGFRCVWVGALVR